MTEPASPAWGRIVPELFRIGYGFPTEAVLEARAHWTDVRKHFLAELGRAVVRPDLVAAEGNALPLYGIYLAAEQRDTDFEPLMLGVMRLPEADIDEIIGNTITEGMARCLASVYAGDENRIKKLAEDESCLIWSRLAAVESMVIRVIEGDADRHAVIEYVFSLAIRRAAALHAIVEKRKRPLHSPDDDILLNSLVAMLGELGAAVCLPAIRDWFAQGLLDPQVESLEGIEATMHLPDEGRLARMHKPHYVSDVIAEMSWWASFTELPVADKNAGDLNRYGGPLVEPLVYASPKIGRNDPCPCGSGKKYKKCCGVDV